MSMKSLSLAFVLVSISSFTAIAQSVSDATQPVLMKIYEEWKQRETASKSDVPEHLAMAVISRRIDASSAQFDIAVINQLGDGKTGNELTLEIQPMIIIRNSAGKAVTSQATGSPTTATLKIVESSGSLSSLNTVTVIVPADRQADAVTVKLVISKQLYGNQKQTLSENTLHMFLDSTANSALMAVTKARITRQ